MSRLRSNFQRGTLTAGVDADDTTLASAEFAGLPAVSGDNYLAIVLDPDATAGDPEIALVTGHSAASTSVTVTRGVEGTAARSHLSGTDWVHAPTAADFEAQERGDSGECAVNISTSDPAGVAVTGCTVVVPARDDPFTIRYGGFVSSNTAAQTFVVVSLLEDGVEIDRGGGTTTAAGQFYSTWREVDLPGGDERTYSLLVKPLASSNDARTLGNALYKFIIKWAVE